MKSITTFIIFLLFAKTATAQKDLLSFDEHNKYIYYQVIDMPGMAADTLHNRVLNFLKSSSAKIKVKLAANSADISGESKFLTHGTSLGLKREDGEITYVLNFEFKDQRYRYWLTDFVFTPYQRDRYANFVPQQGVYIPLETALSKLNKKDVENYLNETGAFCKHFSESIKLYFTKPVSVSAPQKEEPTKKIVVDKW